MLLQRRCCHGLIIVQELVLEFREYGSMIYCFFKHHDAVPGTEPNGDTYEWRTEYRVECVTDDTH